MACCPQRREGGKGRGVLSDLPGQHVQQVRGQHEHLRGVQVHPGTERGEVYWCVLFTHLAKATLYYSLI